MKKIYIWVLGIFTCVGIFSIINMIYPISKNLINNSPEKESLCSSATIQKIIDTTWPQPCNGPSECGIRNTGSTKINDNTCYIWAKLPTFDDSVTSILKSAIVNTNTNTISETYPDLHTCRSNPALTTKNCN